MYDEDFFRAVSAAGARSAAAAVPFVQALLKPRSVVDFGCGQGAWLRAWRDAGVEQVLGLDGAYVNQRALLIEPSQFEARDLTTPIDLGRTFDLVESLEVAEHLPESSSRTIVESLTRHGARVLFSAAVPGQLGEHHVNEQPYEYWRDRFAERGYAMFDCVRPAWAASPAIDPWYRYNTFLFVEAAAVSSLSAEVQATRVAPDAPIRRVAPWSFRLLTGVASVFPQRWQHELALLDKRLKMGRLRRASAAQQGK